MPRVTGFFPCPETNNLSYWPLDFINLDLIFLTNMEVTASLPFLGRQPDVSKLVYSELCTAPLWICKPLLSKNKLQRFLSWNANVGSFDHLLFKLFFLTNVGSNFNVLRRKTFSFPINGNDLLTWWVFSALALGILIWFQQEHGFRVPCSRYTGISHKLSPAIMLYFVVH